jgi:excisionase family DNA binding protein
MKIYLGVADIARLLEKERSTIIRWIKAGKFGRVRKAGNEYRVPYQAFKRWWDANVKGVSSPEGQQ